MAVPKMSQLRPGIGVRVVLKMDQRSGKLTTGQISDILTRGDHPRGIKVRLTNGQVGRVQSLSTSFGETLISEATSYTPSGPNEYPVHPEQPLHSGERRKGRFALQEDYRERPSPYSSTSLAEYMTMSSSSKARVRRSGRMAIEDSTQAELEKEFPHLDSALIAAILADHGSAVDAQSVLYSLS